MFFGDHEDALFLVGAEHEVGGGGDDALDGGEFLGDEAGDLAEVFAFDDDEKVVGSGHEVAGDDLRVFGDAFGEAIEAASAFGGDFDLDDGAYEVDADFLFIDDGAVAEDEAIGLELFNAVENLIGGEVEHFGELLGFQRGVFVQQL
ncbi:MAG: hypothetical protein RI897_2709 [Verrucomicrobiota bacterium]